MGFLNPSVVRMLATEELYKAQPNSFLQGEGGPLYRERRIRLCTNLLLLLFLLFYFVLFGNEIFGFTLITV